MIADFVRRASASRREIHHFETMMGPSGNLAFTIRAEWRVSDPASGARRGLDELSI
jgi:hypothetical protein